MSVDRNHVFECLATFGSADPGAELLLGDRLSEYADEIAILSRFEVEVTQYDMPFAPNECGKLIQDWHERVPALHTIPDQIEEADTVYLGSVLLDDGSVEKETSSQISRDRLAFGNL